MVMVLLLVSGYSRVPKMLLTLLGWSHGGFGVSIRCRDILSW